MTLPNATADVFVQVQVLKVLKNGIRSSNLFVVGVPIVKK